MFYWILTTHLVAFLPLSMLAFSFKKHDQYVALYTFINIFLTVYSSIWYHTYDYDTTVDIHNSKMTWRIMDHWMSSSSIVITSLYCFKVRPPVFYIVANISTIFILYFYLTNELANTIFVFSMILGTMLYKFRVVSKFIRFYYFQSFLVLCTSGIAIYARYIPSESMYYIWHPIWHTCIFITAFIGCNIRHSMDAKLLETSSDEYARAATNSL